MELVDVDFEAYLSPSIPKMFSCMALNSTESSQSEQRRYATKNRRYHAVISNYFILQPPLTYLPNSYLHLQLAINSQSLYQMNNLYASSKVECFIS